MFVGSLYWCPSKSWNSWSERYLYDDKENIEFLFQNMADEFDQYLSKHHQKQGNKQFILLWSMKSIFMDLRFEDGDKCIRWTHIRATPNQIYYLFPCKIWLKSKRKMIARDGICAICFNWTCDKKNIIMVMHGYFLRIFKFLIPILRMNGVIYGCC